MVFYRRATVKKKAIWICATIAAMGIGTAAAAANAGRTEQKAAPAPVARNQTKTPAKHQRHAKGGAAPSGMTTRPHGASTRAPRPPKKVEKPQFNSSNLSRIDRRQA
jgi:hypothetical protein